MIPDNVILILAIVVTSVVSDRLRRHRGGRTERWRVNGIPSHRGGKQS